MVLPVAGGKGMLWRVCVLTRALLAGVSYLLISSYWAYADNATKGGGIPTWSGFNGPAFCLLSYLFRITLVISNGKDIPFHQDAGP